MLKTWVPYGHAGGSSRSIYGVAAALAGLLLAAGAAGLASAGGRVLRPFRSTAAGDLYRIRDPGDVVGVRMVGYRDQFLGSPVGLLALTVSGRLVPLGLVARARARPLRPDRGLVLTRKVGGHQTVSSGGAPTSTTTTTPTTTTTMTTTPTAPTAPTASITSGPANGSTETTNSASFGFTSDQSGSTFQCSLDGGSYSACTSPASYSNLANGSHTFSVKAVNNGLTSNPASVTWAVSVSSTSTCPVPYTSSSPWNTPVSATPTVDPNSAAMIATMTTNTSYPKLGSDPTQFTLPVYNVDSGTATVPVWVAGSWSNVTSSTVLQHSSGGTEIQVPVPMAAQPASGDAQVIVLNQSTGDEWGFWEFYNSTDPVTATVAAGVGTSSSPLPVQNAYADYWVGQQIVIGQGTSNAETAVIASFPDSTHMVLESPTTKPHTSGEIVWAMGASNGYHYNTAWSGVPPSGFTSRGAGVPYLAGLVRPCEIAQGHIDHAIAFAYQNTLPSYIYPATRSDGGAGAGMPEGAHLQLDPSITDSTIQGWGCTGACFTAAKAMQKYGLYLVDTAGHPKVYFEDDSTANWGATVTSSTVTPIPLSDFRVIDG